jgi:Fuc2NAc and GlcNAc transferase
MTFFLCVVLQAAAAATAVKLLGTFARQRRLLDVPNQRSLHQSAVPRLGGAGFGPVILLGAAIWLSVLDERPREVVVALSSAAGIYALGLADDIFSLPSTLRLLIQGAIAAVLLGIFGPQLPVVPGVPGFVGTALLWLWLVGLTNFYNFMDGVDGLAGVQAVIAGSYWAFEAGGLASPAGVIGICIVGAVLGFLCFNVPPARMFMGDAGSTLLGFLFALLPMIASLRRPEQSMKWQEMAGGALVIWPFLLDSGGTVLWRLFRGENVLKAHRSHFYQWLAWNGRSHLFVSTLYGVLSLFGAVLALSARNFGSTAFIVAGCLVVALFSSLQILARRRAVGP